MALGGILAQVATAFVAATKISSKNPAILRLPQQHDRGIPGDPTIRSTLGDCHGHRGAVGTSWIRMSLRKQLTSLLKMPSRSRIR